MSCNPTWHDPQNIVKMRTVNIDENTDVFRRETVKVCKSCNRMVLKDYAEARAKRAVAGVQKHVPLFEGSHL